MKQNHPPLTWARIEQLARAGHDDFEPPLNAPRARQLVASVRERTAELEASKEAGWAIATARVQKLNAANATLERVRAVLPKNHSSLIPSMLVAEAIGGRFEGGEWVWIYPTLPFGSSAKEDWCPNCGCGNNKAGFAHLEGCHLADQPEAPECSYVGSFCGDTGCETHGIGPGPAAPEYSLDQMFGALPDLPEAPKGPAAEADPHGPDHGEADPDYPPHAHAFTDAGPSTRETLLSRLSELQRDLAAAKAKIAELESWNAEQLASRRRGWDAEQALHVDLVAANARADAAERKNESQRTVLMLYVEQIGELQTERDQLAARLKLQAEAARKLQERVDAAERATEAAIAGNSLATQRARAAESNAEDFERSLRSAETYIGEVNERVNQCEAALAAERALLQKTGARLETLFIAAYRACMLWESTQNHSVHDIRTGMQELREVLNKPNCAAFVLQSERDQLAARVTELEGLSCTPEEREVLEASRELQIVTRGSTAYVPPEATEDLGRLLHAELANRAAKAKRGGA